MYTLTIEAEDEKLIQELRERVVVLDIQGIKVSEICDDRKITETIEEDKLTVKFHESTLTVQTLAPKRKSFDKWEQFKTVIFDFDNVTFIDSEVINTFIKLRNNKCDVKIININRDSEVADVLEIIQANIIFDIKFKL